MYVLVDIDIRKILAVRVTDNRMGDSPMLVPLFDEALESCVSPASRSGRASGPTRYSAYGDTADARCPRTIGVVLCPRAFIHYVDVRLQMRARHPLGVVWTDFMSRN